MNNYRLPRLLLALMMLTYLSYFGSFAVQRYLTFETGAFDVGVYAQPLWNMLHGRGLEVSLMKSDGATRLAQHVEPILYLVASLYALFPDPRTLLWLQVSAITLAGLPLYALAVRRLNSEGMAVVVVATFYLMPATQSVTLFDFHGVTLAPLFLLSAIYFLDRALSARGKSFWMGVAATDASPTTALRWYGLSALFFLLALSTKEDISLHVFMVGVYLLLLRRQWREGMVLAGVGLIWFYVTFQIIIPAHRVAGQESIFVGWFEALGDTPLEIALSPITKPEVAFNFVFRASNLPPLAMLTVPFALLPWLGLPYLAIAAPSLAFIMLGDNPTLRQLETWHYATPMLPFVMLATIQGLALLNNGLARTLNRAQQPQPDEAKTQVSEDFARRNTTVVLRYLPTIVLLTVALTYHHLRGYSPLSALNEWPTYTSHHALGWQIAEEIPPEVSVLAQAQLIPQIAHRTELAIWDGPLQTEYDMVWLDLSHHKLPNRLNSHGDFLTGLIIEPNFGFKVMNDGYMLLEQGIDRPPIPETFFTFSEYASADLTGTTRQKATFGDSLRLVAVKPEIRRLATSETEPQVVLYFEVLSTPAQDYQLYLYRLDGQNEVVGATDYSQPALYWWPTSRWKAGETRQVRVNTIPWWTGDQTYFGYAIGFSHIDDPWAIDQRLIISTEQSTLNEQTLLPIAAFRRLGGVVYSVNE